MSILFIYINLLEWDKVSFELWKAIDSNFKLGDGWCILLWHDCWSGVSPLKSILPLVYRVISSQSRFLIIEVSCSYLG